MSNSTQVTPFNFGANEIRVVFSETNEPLWVAKDICDVLGYKEVSKTLSKLDDDEKGTQILSTLGGDQKMTVINESGLYTLILRSNKPEAKKFKKWVTAEVLPTIRKTGSYTLRQPLSNYQIAGYKSQLAQKNKHIQELKAKLKSVKSSTEEEHTTRKVMEFIEKGLKYDELLEKHKAIEMQLTMFQAIGNEALNKMRYLHDQMIASIPYLDAVLNNGMKKDKKLGWKPRD